MATPISNSPVPTSNNYGIGNNNKHNWKNVSWKECFVIVSTGALVANTAALSVICTRPDGCSLSSTPIGLPVMITVEVITGIASIVACATWCAKIQRQVPYEPVP